MQPFKEVPYQNYIELKFSNRNLNIINEEEVLLKYKRNAAILGKVFSFNRDNSQPAYPIQDNKVPLTQEVVEKYRLEVEEEQRLAEKKLKQAETSKAIFNQIVNQTEKITTRRELQQMIATLKENNLYDQTHPYLMEASPFYLNNTNAQILEVTSKDQQGKSCFDESDMVFEEIQ